MIGIVRERLERPDARGGFVLDGFPRTVAQAAALDGIMAGRDPLIVVDIVVPEAELVRRLGTRLICDDCGAQRRRSAATVGAALRASAADGWCSAPTTTRRSCCERLKVYHRQTEPLVEYYRVRPTFRSINGAQPPDRVAADLAAAIEARRQRRRRRRRRAR